MSVRYGPPLIPGAVVYGDSGLGKTGAAIRALTATGTHGAGLLYNDWDSGDDAKSFMARIVTPPASGTLFVDEYGAFSLTDAPDGTYSLVYKLVVDGVDLGNAPPATFTVGGGSANASGQLTSIGVSAPAAGASGGAGALGGIASVSLSAPAAEATGGSTGEGFASGNLAATSLSAPSASGSGGGFASGLLAGLTLAAPQGSASTQLPTVARPVADIAQGAWLPSVGNDLYAMLDEADAGGLDYIFATAVGAKCEVALNDTEFPGGSSQRFYYEAESATSTSVIVSLKQGGTVIASWVQALNPSTTVYSRDLSPAEIALIGPGAVSVELEVSA